MALNTVSKSFGAAGQASDPVLLANGFTVTLLGEGTWTVALEAKVPGTSQYVIADSFTAAGRYAGCDPAGAEYRLRCTALTSGNPLGVLESC